jgi:hypothetical protein
MRPFKALKILDNIASSHWPIAASPAYQPGGPRDTHMIVPKSTPAPLSDGGSNDGSSPLPGGGGREETRSI